MIYILKIFFYLLKTIFQNTNNLINKKKYIKIINFKNNIIKLYKPINTYK